jgi:hypothetical protein
MEIKEYLTVFLCGLGVGLVFLLLNQIKCWKLGREFNRYKLHLSDKMELEAKQLIDIKKQLEKIVKENEQLRVKIEQTKSLPDQQMKRDLELMSRVVKQLTTAAPGFIHSWEQTLQTAEQELQLEEQGKKPAQTWYRRLLSSNS